MSGPILASALPADRTASRAMPAFWQITRHWLAAPDRGDVGLAGDVGRTEHGDHAREGARRGEGMGAMRGSREQSAQAPKYFDSSRPWPS